MIRIDEIYENTFLPWIKNNLPDTVVYYHYPFGQSDFDSLRFKIDNPPGKKTSFIYLFDQEPMISDLHDYVFDQIDQHNSYTYKTIDRLDDHTTRLLDRTWVMRIYSRIKVRAPGIIIVSETESDNIDYICEQRNLRPFYYFFHGWAALDWYRGYDRTFLVTPWTERKIKKTFFSANRIIGGLRQHRVLMLYHFQKSGLMHNWISASAVCPAENAPIREIAAQYQDRYPDIVDVIDQIDLPRLFPGEDSTRMSSCWLDQFDICAESLIYHVTETVYTGRRLHLTEKSFKPIALGMPFILTATAGSLAYLRSYGFKTFGKFWDESYDVETDDFVRAEKVAELLKQLDDLSDKKKQELFHACWPVIEHNWNWFYQGGFESVLWTEFTHMLTSIKVHLSR
jgi:hypothetical protein